MAAQESAHHDPLAGLLADLDTIASEASAGFGSRRDYRLEPGETRPAAILFIDVVGFTNLARKLDTENLSRLIDRTFRIFDLSVCAEGGYCDKVIGDAGLYVFAGHPNFAPACEAALNAALSVRERIRRINASLAHTGMSIAVRAGVSFGIVTRTRIGGESQQITVMGEAVNLAQRLENTAIPGTIQTVESVLQEAGSKFVTELRGELELKGFEPQAVYTVESRLGGPRLRSGMSRLTPLIGRDRILNEACSLVEGWWKEAIDSANPDSGWQPPSRLLVLRGPTAIGKSRLALETVTRLRETPGNEPNAIACATAHCTEHTGLLEFAAELCAIAGLTRDNLPARWEELARASSQTWGADRAEQLASHLPVLAYVLQCDAIDTSGIRQADSASFSLACRRALKAVIELAALESRGMAVLVVEDLQWLGSLRETLCWLLTNCAPELPLVIVGTARPGFEATPAVLGELLGIFPSESAALEQVADQVPAAIAVSAQSTLPTEPFAVLDIEPLTMEEGEELVQALLPGLELPPSVRTELHEKSLGLPYYYEEVARMLLADGAVCEVDGCYEPTREIAGLDMPSDFRMLILGRLDLLRPELRELAGHASVLGRSFEVDMLERIETNLAGGRLKRLSGVGNNQASKKRLDSPASVLASLIDGLVHERVFSRDTGGRVFFEHRLTYEAAYASLLQDNRRQLHRAAANVLSESIQEGGNLLVELRSELVHHLEGCQDTKEAHIRACRLASNLLAYRQLDLAKTWTKRAKELYACLGTEPECRSQLYQIRVQALFERSLGEHALEEELLEKAASLITDNQQDEVGKLVLIDLAHVKQMRGDLLTAESRLLDAIALQVSPSVPHIELMALLSLGSAYRAMGLTERAIKCWLEVKEGSEREGLLRPAAYSSQYLGCISLEQSRFEQAEQDLRFSLEVARQLLDTTLEGQALEFLGVLHHIKGENLDLAESFYVESARVNQSIGSWYLVEVNRVNLAELALSRSDPATALNHLLTALKVNQRSGNRVQYIVTLCTLTKTCCILGDLAGAQKYLSLSAESLDMLPNEMLTPGLTGQILCAKANVAIEQQQWMSANLLLNEATCIMQTHGLGESSPLGTEVAWIEDRMRNLKGQSFKSLGGH